MSERFLGPDKALRLISSFLDQEWRRANVRDVRVERIAGGLMNTLHLVSRNNASVQEPSAVLVRHFGLSGKPEEPTETSLTLSTAQQTLVYWEMGRRGWGPKVYGLFPGGRVEEYIPSHALTAAEACQSDIIRDVARSYARFHSLDLPLRRDNFTRVVEVFSKAATAKRDEVLTTLSAIEGPQAKSYSTTFANIDWTSELQWIFSLFAKHNSRTTLTHLDANYLNILVKDTLLEPASYDKQNAEPRTMLIDYETTTYGPRGLDIGGHFNERQYAYNQSHTGTQLSGYRPHSISEQRLFCSAYLDETRRLGVELDDEQDTVEHLLLEAEIGRMYQILLTNLMCTVFDEVEVDPVFLEGLGHMMGVYSEVKKEFASKHGV